MYKEANKLADTMIKELKQTLGKKDLVWTGHFFEYGGLAYNNRTYVKGLIERGYSVGIESLKSVIDLDPEEAMFFNSLRRFDENGNPLVYGIDEAGNIDTSLIKVFGHLPFQEVPRFKKNILYSMIETSGLSPKYVEDTMSNYDCVWTPTHWNKSLFQEAGIDLPISVLPIPIDPRYRPEAAATGHTFNYKVFSSRTATPEPSGFRFLSVSRWSFRKGFDTLLKAFLQGFKDSDNVCLVLFTRHMALSDDPVFQEQLQQELEALYSGLAGPDAPPVYLCSDKVPDSLMTDMYRTGDAFILCSRGEGFSLPTLEASAMGLPVIVPYHTAFTDYATDQNSYLFQVDSYRNYSEVEEWSKSFYAPWYENQTFPYLLSDSCIEQVSSLMQEVKNNYDFAKGKNTKLQEQIRQRYSKDTCIDLIEFYLKEL